MPIERVSVRKESLYLELVAQLKAVPEVEEHIADACLYSNRRLRCPLGKDGRTQPIEWSKRRPTACMGRSTK